MCIRDSRCEGHERVPVDYERHGGGYGEDGAEGGVQDVHAVGGEVPQLLFEQCGRSAAYGELLLAVDGLFRRGAARGDREEAAREHGVDYGEGHDAAGGEARELDEIAVRDRLPEDVYKRQARPRTVWMPP